MPDADPKRRLADWFRRWRSPLRKFLTARGAVRVADLDDVAQEVFLRLMRYDRTELIEHPQAYLFKMATNVAAEWAIRGRYVKSREPQWLADIASEDRVEDEANQIALQDEIECALKTLTPRQREVMKLQFYEGLGRNEIADRLATTERSVKRLLMKSYAKLRSELRPELLKEVSDGRE
jgi:RNA polymerase sigma factor (sigma-70 family)